MHVPPIGRSTRCRVAVMVLVGIALIGLVAPQALGARRRRRFVARRAASVVVQTTSTVPGLATGVPLTVSVLTPGTGPTSTVVGSTVVGSTVVGSTVVGSTVVGSTVVGSTVVGSTVVGSTVVGSTVVGSTVAGVGSTAVATTRAFPTTIPIVGDYRGVDRSRPLDRLLTPRAFAAGTFRFVPPPAGLRARNGPGGAQALALRTLPKTFRALRSEVFFAVFLGRGSAKDAPAWAILYTEVPGQRSTGVVKRRAKAGSTVPTTAPRDVVTDVLVVVDDRTGAVVVRSEFAPGS